MRVSPCYRNLKDKNYILGLEIGDLLLLLAFYIIIKACNLSPGKSLLTLGGGYLFLRIFKIGKPAGHMQHWAEYHIKPKEYLAYKDD